jgi:hypothetical protein
LDYLPNHALDGESPEVAVEELESLVQELDKIHDDEPRMLDYEIAGLRAGVLLESIFVLHKAGNAFVSAHAQAAAGFRTCARATFYQAAFMSMRGILGLLGVCMPRHSHSNRYFQMDLWSEPTRRVSVSTGPRRRILVVRRGTIAHKEYWSLFQRLLRVVRWPAPKLSPECMRAVSRLEPRDFAKQRSQLQYDLRFWMFDDIRALSSSDTFVHVVSEAGNGGAFGNSLDDDFCPALSLLTMQVGLGLLDDLARNSQHVRGEADLLRQWLQTTPGALGHLF